MNTIHQFLQRHLPLLLRVFLVIFILLVLYAIFLYFGFVHFFNGALSQGATLLGCRALSASLIKMGFPASLTLCLFWGVKALLTTLPETVHMVSPRGGDGQALPLPGPSDPAGPSSIQNYESDSGSWRNYLTLSSGSEIEVNQTPGRQAPPLPIESGTVPPANAVAFSEAGPSQVAPPAPSSTPSNSSTWSGPWIERRFYPEVSSPGGQPQGEEAASQPIGVMGPAVPTKGFLKKKIVLVLRSCTRSYRRPRSDLLQRIEEDLRLETASPEKRLKIAQVLEELYTNRDFFVNSDQRPDYELTVAVADWERGL